MGSTPRVIENIDRKEQTSSANEPSVGREATFTVILVVEFHAHASVQTGIRVTPWLTSRTQAIGRFATLNYAADILDNAVYQKV